MRTVVDEQGLASAALRWTFDLAPGASRSVAVVLPLSGELSVPSGADATWARSQLDAVALHWRERLNHVALVLPAAGQATVDTLRSSLAHMLMSRDGPALQPGTRSYARTWVRDGAMMVAGLLRLGEVQAAREFVQWYARFLFANGNECWGAFAANRIDMSNDMRFHFDETLLDHWAGEGQDGSDPVSVLAWQRTAVMPSSLLADRRDPMSVLDLDPRDLLSPGHAWGD